LVVKAFHVPIDLDEFRVQHVREQHKTRLEQTHDQVVRVHADEVRQRSGISAVHLVQTERGHGHDNGHTQRRDHAVEPSVRAAFGGGRGRVRIVQLHPPVVRRHRPPVPRPHHRGRHETRDAQRTGVHAGPRALGHVVHADAVQLALEVRRQRKVKNARRQNRRVARGPQPPANRRLQRQRAPLLHVIGLEAPIQTR